MKGLIATPTGRGVGHEGNAVELKGAGPWYLIVGCDGQWEIATSHCMLQMDVARMKAVFLELA